MPPPEVSVIIPGHNCEAFIREAIESVLAQTYSDLEIIFVDDGSSDQTPAVVREFKDKVAYLRLASPSGGPARPRNHGIQLAHARYVALLDADDLWLPHKLEEQLAQFRGDDPPAVVYSDAYQLRGNVRQGGSFETAPPHRGWVFPHLLTRNFIPCLTALIDAQALKHIGPFNEDYLVTADWDLWLRISLHYRIEFCPDPLAEYRVHGTNISLNRERQYVEVLTILGALATQRSDAVGPHLSLVREHCLKWHQAMAKYHRNRHNWRRAALCHLRYLMRSYPW